MSDRARMSWKVWIFKASEEFELPCGCVGVWRRVEDERGVREFVVCCPVRITERQAACVFQGVKELRRTVGKGPSWYVMRHLYLEMDFQECVRRPGEFKAPKFKPGPSPSNSKAKVKDPGARLKALKFHEVKF